MAKSLTIILGAGASHSQNPDSKSLDHQEYRPPLTQDVFSTSRSFAAILQKYQLAETLASDINLQLRQNKAGIGLEQILKLYEKRLSAGEDSHITRQFLQIPLYLNDLFGEISQHFTHQPDEYVTLVNHVLDKIDKVLFLTLNYDTLLEIPLSRFFNIDFSESSHYLTNPKWMLAKLHGSVNWYRSFNSYQVSEINDHGYFGNLNEQKLPLSLGDDYLMVAIPGHQRQFIENTPVYPAITVPVDGKYDISCPQGHIEKTKQFLSDCHNYLIIGTSGKDKDLLDLLKTNTKGGKILIVDRNEENVNNTRESFMLAIPQFQTNIGTFYHQRGFSEFVDSGQLDSFLDSLV